MEHQLSQGKKRHRIIYYLVMSAVFNLKVDLPRFCIQKYSTTFSNVTLLRIRHIATYLNHTGSCQAVFTQ